MRVTNFISTPVMRTTLRLTAPRILSPSVPVQTQRKLLNEIGRLAVYPRGTTIDRTTLGGRPSERILIAGADPRRTVLYLHGGAYIVGGPDTHRALAAHLAAASRAAVHLLDYRLAPEAPYPAAVDDVLAAYRQLRDTPVTVTVAGDSAGGGLALVLMTLLRDAGEPLPEAAALISPLVDLTLAQVEDASRDPILRRAWLQAAADAYASGTDLASPGLSPLFADLTELPPLLVQAASEEILAGDVERLVAALRSAKISVQYQQLEGLWHAAHLQAGLVPAATDAVDAVGGFLSTAMQQHLL